jgi:uncharacterized protein YdbL (DUF1318 family)
MEDVAATAVAAEAARAQGKSGEELARMLHSLKVDAAWRILF